jgi:hypothetical protein
MFETLKNNNKTQLLHWTRQAWALDLHLQPLAEQT